MYLPQGTNPIDFTISSSADALSSTICKMLVFPDLNAKLGKITKNSKNIQPGIMLANAYNYKKFFL